ncbi:hypothetical protein [Pedobacter sp. V48]|uniref:hypothetical protein n=1 Tax=Pedobacter sp. V48 TaxID=509635 RepID=UPI0012680530|nr:hypothetical protein [Pedobacter sp. V48]
MQHRYLGAGIPLICTSFSVIPLLVKTLQEKKASDACWITIIVLIVRNSLWTYYGCAELDTPILNQHIFLATQHSHAFLQMDVQ